MADTELASMTEDTAPATTDWIYKVDSGGTADRKVTIANLSASSAFSPSIDNLTAFNTAYGSALSYDYEFAADTTSLPSGWSWVNQSTSTYQEKGGKGAISAPATSTVNWRLLMRALPSESTWTAYAKLTAYMSTAADAFFGLLLRESSSGKLQDVSCYPTTSAFYVSRWTNATTYSTSPAGPLADHVARSSTVYFRIKRNSATSYDFSMSPDGVLWRTILAANDVSAFMTPDQIGFGLDVTNNIVSGVACDWFRVR